MKCKKKIDVINKKKLVEIVRPTHKVVGLALLTDIEIDRSIEISTPTNFSRINNKNGDSHKHLESDVDDDERAHRTA